MPTETDLLPLLSHLQPNLQDGEYVFCQRQPGEYLPEGNVGPLCVFYETEGLSLILPRSVAESLGWDYDYVAAWITLQVDSDLTAVGLTAAVSTALAKAGISCNVVAAFQHDHLFVPAERADEALWILQNLACP